MSPWSCTVRSITQYVIEIPQRHVIDRWKSLLCKNYCLRGFASNAKVHQRRWLLNGHSHEKPKTLYAGLVVCRSWVEFSVQRQSNRSEIFCLGHHQMPTASRIGPWVRPQTPPSHPIYLIIIINKWCLIMRDVENISLQLSIKRCASIMCDIADINFRFPSYFNDIIHDNTDLESVWQESL
jgi:hypothetical protein